MSDSEKPVSAELYTSDYFLERCGGVEFFKKFGYKVLKPASQAAVLAADCKPDHDILDVGCGRGELVAHLCDRGFRASGIDYSPEAIDVARRMYPTGDFVLLDAGRSDFGSRQFDRVFVLGVIEHLRNSEHVFLLEQLDRVLKGNGRVMMTTCTNNLYYKVWTYRIRLKMAQLLTKLGISMKDPIPPRSDEDESLHVNELNYFDLKRRFSTDKWKAKIWPQPNPKLIADKLYPPVVLQEAPIKPASQIRQLLYRTLVFRFPLNLFLARSYLLQLERRA